MLFCPFCGTPVVIPAQDDFGDDESVIRPVEAYEETKEEQTEELPDKPAEHEPANPSPEPSGDASVELLKWNEDRTSLSDVWARPDQQEAAFSPLTLETSEASEKDWREALSKKKQAHPIERHAPDISRPDPVPVQLEGNAPALELDVKGAKSIPGSQKKHRDASTLVPTKALDPEDLFMDRKGPHVDDTDPYDRAGFEEQGGFTLADGEDSSFFQRHLRGIVGLSMFVILVLMFVIYAFSRPGQLTLGRANLAWSTEAYSTLGYENYQSGAYEEAGRYYEKALTMDSNNYNYASSAAMAYFEAGNIEKSTEMLKHCVEIEPARLEPYMYLLKLYPDSATRPWDITQLLQQGYRQTGDGRLNVTG